MSVFREMPMTASPLFDGEDLTDVYTPSAAESTSGSDAQAGTNDSTVVTPPGAATNEAPQRRPLPLIHGYEILGELGRGGMGVVYRARETRLNRACALKMILAGGHANDEAVARFLGEAEVVARLQHANIVQIHRIGTADGLPFFELEYVGGGSLDARLDGVPWPPRRAAELIESLARGIAEAHRQGIVHRDLKPANVLLAEDGTPKITDFGLAKSLEKDSGLTRSDSVLGSPGYMAPEQAHGRARDVGPLADVYGLGAILYQLLTGRPPFRGATVLETLEQVKTAEPVPPSRLVPGLPRDIETITLKCLQKDAAKRYNSAAALRDDVRHFLNGESIVARQVGLHERAWRWCRRHPAPAALTAAVILVAGLGVAGILWEWRDAVEARNLASKREIAEAEARHEIETMLVDMYTTSGLQAGDQHDLASAALWFANAARRAKGDAHRRAANALRVRTWGRGAFAPLRAVVLEDAGWPGSLAFHPGGKHLLTRTVIDGGTREARYHLWDLDAERPLVFPGGATAARAAAWSPNGRDLAMASEERDAFVSRFPSADEADRVPFAERVRLLSWSPDGRYLAIAGGNSARVWDVSAHEFATAELVHPAAVTTLAFDPKARLIATGCRDNQARLFAVDHRASEPLWPAVAHIQKESRGHWDPQFCSPPAFGDEGRDLITYSGDALIWRATDTGKEEARLVPPELPPNLAAAEPSPDGRLLAIFTVQHTTVRLVETATARVTGPAFEHQNTVYSTSISPDNRFLLTSSSDNKAHLWSASGGPPLATLDLHRTINQVAFAPDGTMLATQDADLVRLWSIPGEPLAIHRVRLGPYSFAATSRDGSLAIPTGVTIQSPSRMRETKVYRVASGEPAGATLVPGGIIVDATFSPDARTVAIAAMRDEESTLGDDVQVWDWEQGVRQWRAEIPSAPRSLAFRPDGKRLAVLCRDGLLLVLDAADGSAVGRWKAAEGSAPNNWINNGKLSFSPDGGSLLTWGMGNDVSVWESETGRRRYEPLPHRDICHDVQFSPDGRLMALASYDGSVRVRELTTGALLAELPAHPDNVYSVRFSADGRLLATACRDRSVRVWDWNARRLVSPPLEHPADATAVAFTPDGRWVLSASAAQQGARAWDWRTGMPVTPLLSVDLAMTMALTPDGRHAVVGGFSGALALLQLDELVSTHGGAEVPDAEIDTLYAWAELVSGRQLHPGGGMVNLSADEWLARWRASSARPPIGD